MGEQREPQPSTQRAYRSDRLDFERWCAERRAHALPAAPDDVAAYLHECAEILAPSTVARRLAAIVDAHHQAGHVSPRQDPAVRAAVASAQWHHRQRRRTTEPLNVEALSKVSSGLPATVSGDRDRAIIVVGYAGALRRTELVGLDVADLQVERDGGLHIRLERGDLVAPPARLAHLCPVRAWRRWQHTAGLRDGPAFRPVDRYGNVAPMRLSDKAVTAVVKRAVARAGLDPDRFSGRSLRLGMVLAAAAIGASDEEIMAQTGHRTRRLVHGYRMESPADPTAAALS